jgi:glycosyltransferase involved in cell wall biosynthesis
MRSRPRIAVAACGLGHITRGIEAWADDLARALHNRGEAVTLYKGGGHQDAEYERVLPCLQRDGGTNRLVLRGRRFLWRFGLGSPYGIEQSTFSLNLIRELRANRIDILHVQDPRVALNAQWARRFGLIRTKTILAHGTSETLEFQRRIRYLQHLAPWHLEQAQIAGFSRPEWTAIPNFVDTDVFSPGRADALRRELGIPAEHLVFLSVAAIKRDHKRIDHLIGEFARFRNLRPEVGATLVVAGGYEPETDEVIKLGRELLGDRVRFLVRYPRARIPELYRAADVFVLCSLREMMPIAVLEAVASGLPCLVHRHPILEWMTGPGGRPLDMAEPGRLAAELADLADRPTERQRLGAAARRHGIEEFGRDRVVDRLVQYYAVVRASSGRPRAALLTGPGSV